MSVRSEVRGRKEKIRSKVKVEWREDTELSYVVPKRIIFYLSINLILVLVVSIPPIALHLHPKLGNRELRSAFSATLSNKITDFPPNH